MERSSNVAGGSNNRGCDSRRQGDMWYKRLRADRLCMFVAGKILGRGDGMVRMVW